MKSIRRFALPAVSLLAMLVGVLLATTGPAVAKQIQEVLVVNGTNRPVPVTAQGTTTVAGTVGIDSSANTVTVGNGTNHPVPVSAQGTTTVAGTVGINPAANAISGTVSINPNGNLVIAKNGTSFTTFFQTFTTDSLGQIFLTGPMDARGFSKVSIEIIQFPTAVPGLSVSVTEGKISGSTLAQFIDVFPLASAAKIRTYDVMGPEFSLVLTGGPPNTQVALQAWVYFS